MELEDGPFAVLGEPREVNDESQLQGFLAHVSSPLRTLPVIALAHRPQTRFYGVDPRGLATAVRGLAHVICLDPAIATARAPPGCRARRGAHLQLQDTFDSQPP